MNIFDMKLAGLAMLVGHEEYAEQFNTEYEELLEEVREWPGDKRTAALKRLRALIDKQLLFLANAWLKEAATLPEYQIMTMQ